VEHAKARVIDHYQAYLRLSETVNKAATDDARRFAAK
jgi:hypothetical protein